MAAASLKKAALLAAVALASAHIGTASAQYPDKPITVVVPSSAGGPADVSIRLVNDRLSKALGQSLVIETVPGAGGTIGMARVARAAPDGYTLLVHQIGFVITPALYAKLNFDTAKDFVTVGMLNHSASLLVGRASLPAKDFAELVGWMKSPSVSAKFAHPGAGTLGHLTTNMLLRGIGAEASLISYRGIAPAVTDLLGGHIDLAIVSIAVAHPLVRDGKLKGLATTGAQRSGKIPDVPSYAELGQQHMVKPSWHALFAPSATPRPVLEKLNAALRETLSDPAVQKAYAAADVEAYPQTLWSLEAVDAYMRGELEVWGKTVRDLGIRIE